MPAAPQPSSESNLPPGHSHCGVGHRPSFPEELHRVHLPALKVVAFLHGALPCGAVPHLHPAEALEEAHLAVQDARQYAAASDVALVPL